MDAPRSLNIASALSVVAQVRPRALAVICPSGSGRPTTWTFHQLDRESDILARGLSMFGIGRGVRSVLMVTPGLEFFALTFALFKAGAVPVLIDPGMGVKNLGRCLDEAEPEAFLGIPRAQLARRLLGWGRRSLRTTVTVKPGGKSRSAPSPHRLTLVDLRAAGASTEEPFPAIFSAAETPAAILFTSGSTGPPKGAVYTQGIFDAQVRTLRDLYGIEPGEVDLCTFPLFALFAPALGMTSVVPEMDATRPARVDPVKIIDAIQTFRVTNMFGSPALLKRVGQYGTDRGLSLPTLRRVVSAGAPVPAKIIEQFATMLNSDVQIFTPYGATEALPVASIGSQAILQETRKATDTGAGVCVGTPVPGIRVEVIRISDDPIPTWSEDLRVPDGTIGEIIAQGPVVTSEYFHRPEANRLAKIAGPSGLWHRMGDLGYRDPKGRLWFCGRKAHRVITNEGTLFTIPIEAVFNTHPEVNRTALVGVGLPGQSRPVLCVEPNRWPLRAAERRAISAELSTIGSRHEHTKVIGTILFRKSFPVDIRHNAKIFREKLAVWAARRL